jgi:hypothetical protein
MVFRYGASRIKDGSWGTWTIGPLAPEQSVTKFGVFAIKEYDILGQSFGSVYLNTYAKSVFGYLTKVFVLNLNGLVLIF